jgi:hypothetical protein
VAPRRAAPADWEPPEELVQRPRAVGE